MEIFYLNGRFLPTPKALIRVDNLGLIRGYGCFDYLRTFKRKPFEVKMHFERLLKSGRRLNLKCPVGEAEFKRIILTLIKKNKHLKELGIRTVLVGGVTKDGKTAKKASFFIIIEKPSFYPKSFYQKGVKVILKEFKRTFPEVKTIDYIFPLTFEGLLKKEKAFEILYTFGGKVLECSRSNFFIVRDKKIITPKKDILKGVTRDVVIRLAKENGLRVEEREVEIEELWVADEAFLTATDKKIMPVVKIEERKIGDGKVGPIVKNLIKTFQDYLNKNP